MKFGTINIAKFYKLKTITIRIFARQSRLKLETFTLDASPVTHPRRRIAGAAAETGANARRARNLLCR